jgi:hypothetical protein
MTVNTAAPLILPFTLGTGAGAVMGQGLKPELLAYMSFDDVSDPTPNWTQMAPDRVRSFSSSRGRESELSEHDAGTATVVLSNRDRAFDPTYASSPYYPNVRPLNQVWLLRQFNGDTESMFKGYVESYDMSWPDAGMSDSLATANAVDEIKILNLQKLPDTDPPRDSYSDLIGFDDPVSYWKFQDLNLKRVIVPMGVRRRRQATEDEEHGGPAGPIAFIPRGDAYVWGFADWIAPGNYSVINETPVVGDIVGSSEDGVGGCLRLGSTAQLKNAGLDAGDARGTTKFSVELWLRKSTTPGATAPVVRGPASTAVGTIWTFDMRTDGKMQFSYKDTGGVAHSVISTTALLDNVWYHLVGEVDDTTMRVFVNGVQDNTAGTTGAIGGAGDLTDPMEIRGIAGVTSIDVDELAIYLQALPAARVLAHYTSATSRGLPSQLPGARINAVLDAGASDAPRSIQAGSRTMHPTFLRGQAPINEIALATAVEKPDGMFFAARDGTLIFLAADHRSNSPYNTTQLTFGDEGTGVFYESFEADYSDSWLANEWNVNRIGRGGVLQTAYDATSISRYFKFPKTVADLEVTLNSVCATLATAYLAKYKDPMYRGQSLTLTTDDVNVTDAIFDRDLGDRVRVIRTQPRGLGTFDQVMYIQKIDVEGANDQGPWKIKLGLSPL